MILRPEIEFSSIFPDDSIQDESDYAQWPGRNIAEALKAGLEARGYRVSEPIHAEEHGWELDVSRGRKRLWLQVSVLDADVNYLIARNMTFFLWPDIELFRTFLSDLQTILSADDRFSRIRWYRRGGIAGDLAPADGPFAV